MNLSLLRGNGRSAHTLWHFGNPIKSLAAGTRGALEYDSRMEKLSAAIISAALDLLRR